MLPPLVANLSVRTGIDKNFLVKIQSTRCSGGVRVIHRANSSLGRAADACQRAQLKFRAT
jgi:hypothetical protein